MSTNKNELEQKRRDAEPTIIAANHPAALLEYAQRIARRMAADHYRKNAAAFTPYGDLFGVLEQIDNMACGLIRGNGRQLENIKARRAKTNHEQI